MEEALNFLQTHPLFRDLSRSQIAQQIEAMNGTCRTVSKGSVLLREGEIGAIWGILLQGKLCAQFVNEDGDLSVLKTPEKGEVFGEILVFSQTPAPVTLAATEDCRVLILRRPDLNRLHPTLTRNLLDLIGKEYWALHRKIRYCSIRSLRKRILAYLHDCEEAPFQPFRVPLDRAGSAAYLNADRSAFSRELSRMKRDGILEYRKDLFRFLPKTEEISAKTADSHVPLRKTEGKSE